MSSENGSEPNYHGETWLDWMPPGMTAPPPEELLTRTELLAEIRGVGLDTTPRTLQSWEALGILPRPIRQWHQGAVRALYPRWFVHLVEIAVLTRQRERWSPSQIAEHVRSRTREAVALDVMERMEPIPDGFNTALSQMAARRERLSGRRVDAVEVRFLDECGRTVSTYLRPIGHH